MFALSRLAGVVAFLWIGGACASARPKGLPSCLEIPDISTNVRLATQRDSGLVSDSGSLVVTVTPSPELKRQFDPVSAHVRVGTRIGGETGMGLLLTAGHGQGEVRAAPGNVPVRVLSIGSRTVTAQWQARAGYRDSLVAELFPKNCVLPGVVVTDGSARVQTRRDLRRAN